MGAYSSARAISWKSRISAMQTVLWGATSRMNIRGSVPVIATIIRTHKERGSVLQGKVATRVPNIVCRSILHQNTAWKAAATSTNLLRTGCASRRAQSMIATSWSMIGWCVNSAVPTSTEGMTCKSPAVCTDVRMIVSMQMATTSRFMSKVGNAHTSV